MSRLPFPPLLLLAFPAVSVVLFAVGLPVAAWAVSNAALCALILAVAFLRERPLHAAESETPEEPEAEPFAVSREQLRDESFSPDTVVACQLVEQALTYYMPPDAREWAEDGLRFLRAGQIDQGISAVVEAYNLTDSPVPKRHLAHARQLVAGAVGKS